MLFNFTLLILLVTFSWADIWHTLSPSQQSYVKYAHDYCKKFNLQNSCAAIAYVESAGGKYQVGDGDWGLMQINLKSHLRRIDVKPSIYTNSQVSTKLMVDVNYNLKYAVIELQYWLQYHRGSYLLAYSSYNGGHIPNLSYGQHVMDTIQQLRPHLKDN